MDIAKMITELREGAGLIVMMQYSTIVSGMVIHVKLIQRNLYLDKLIEPEANIIFIDLTSLRYEDLKEYHNLNNYIEGHYESAKENYLFIDDSLRFAERPIY